MYQDDQQMAPRRKALIDMLGGGNATPQVEAPRPEMSAEPIDKFAPDAATAAANRAKSPLAGMLAGVTADPGQSAQQPIDYGKTVGQYTGNKYFGAYDEGKFNDPTHDTPKYQALRTLSHFDPSQGVNDEVLKALNGLNLGTFARNGGSNGTGDKVSLSNADPRWEGMTGADLITDFGGKNQWGVAGDFPGAEEAQAAPQAGGGFGGVQLDSALDGDPLAKIREAIAALSGNRPNAAALMQQLGS